MGEGSCVAVICGVGHRHDSDPVLLWLWPRPAAIAPMRPLAWEFPYAMGAALKRKKKKREKKRKERKKTLFHLFQSFLIFCFWWGELPHSIWSSPASNQIEATVATSDAAAVMPDPYPLCPVLIKPASQHCRDTTCLIVPQQELIL